MIPPPSLDDLHQMFAAIATGNAGVDDAATDDRPSMGRTALMIAAANNRVEEMRWLLARGADIIAPDRKGGALTEAAYWGAFEAAQFLLESGADPNAGGGSALEAASLPGRTDIIHLLLEHGAVVTSEHVVEAIEGVRPEIAEGLLDYLPATALSAPTSRKDTLLHRAVRFGRRDVVRRLLDRGAHIEAVDSDGFTPTLAASHAPHSRPNLLRIAKLLIRRGANVHARTPEGFTPLMLCGFGVEPGAYKADFARLLLDHGADINARADHGQTALAVAVRNGHQNLVALLLERDADPGAADDFGQTALTLAARHGHSAMAEIMRSAAPVPPSRP
jgi:ankyrin repeat protein